MAKRQGPSDPEHQLNDQVQAALEESRRGSTSAFAAAERDFRMPPVHPGMAVVWRPGRDDEPAACLVVLVEDRTIDVCPIPATGGAFGLVESVRHRDDPTLLRLVDDTSGCWDYAAADAELMAALDRVGVPYLGNATARQEAAERAAAEAARKN